MSRPFGNVRKLKSGRYRARFQHPDTGREHAGPHTFKTKTDARVWLSQEEVRLRSGLWTDPTAGRTDLTAYATDWLGHKVELRPTTRRLYEGFLRNHILPALGSRQLRSLTPADIRQWHGNLLKHSGCGQPTVAKVYRLLSQIMRTATEDLVIPRNPCTIKGAGSEKSAETVSPTTDDVMRLIGAVPHRYLAMVTTAAFAGLRFGELAGLERRHIDPLHMTIRVEQQLAKGDSGLEIRAPKTDAGVRTIRVSKTVMKVLVEYLEIYGVVAPDAFVFTSPNGGPLDRHNFRRRVWKPAQRATGLEAVRFHDLRHHAGTLFADSGVPPRALQRAMGHSTVEASLRYQHATEAHAEEIAAHVDEAVQVWEIAHV